MKASLAEYAHIPFAASHCLPCRKRFRSKQSPFYIFPTGYFAADEAEVTSGDTRPSLVAAPFGLFAIPSAGLLGRRRISLPLTARRVVSMWLRA